MPKNKSLVRQVQATLQSKLKTGESKHLAKKEGRMSEGIYSWNTYKTYRDKGSAFVRWVKEHYDGIIIDGDSSVVARDAYEYTTDPNDGHSIDNDHVGVEINNDTGKEIKGKPKTLSDYRKYVDIYLQDRIDQDYSPSTQKTIASALAKLYGCSTMDFIKTQVRHRADITRSRVDKETGEKKAKFSEERNKEFVNFCRATGLRRDEIKYLKPENLRYDQATKQYKLINIKGKGGKVRERYL